MKRYFAHTALLVGWCWLFGGGVTAANGQREFSKWCVNSRGLWWLDFTQPMPVAVPPIVYSGYLGVGANLSSPCGRLLFGSYNGFELFANDGQPFVGATQNDPLDSLGICSFCGVFSPRPQQFAAVPQPANRERYWLFSLSSHLRIEQPLKYAILDMSLDGGRGQLLTKGNRLGRHVNRLVTAVRHANGRDFWVMTRDVATREYVAYYLGPKGLDTVAVRSGSGYIVDSLGGIKFSPDGRWVTVAGFTQATGTRQLVQTLARFDATTGRVGAEQVLDQLTLTALRRNGFNEVFWMADFSADSHYLYVPSSRDRYPIPHTLVIHQFDLTGGNVAGTRQEIGAIRETDPLNPQTRFGTLGFGLQLTPRGEIVVMGGEYNLAPVFALPLIRHPERMGVASELDLVGYPIPARSHGSPPNIITGMMLDTLPEIRHFPVRCPQDSVPFWAANPGCADSVRWDFGDPASGPANRTGAWFPGHRFSGPGTYAVTATFNDGRVLTRPVLVPADSTARILVSGGGCARDTVQFTVAFPGCVDSVRWDFGDPASGPANTSRAWAPAHVFSQPGPYAVTATLADGRVLQTTVAYDPRPALPEPPNVFTPNDDGRNEVFQPVPPDFNPVGYTLRVYNRWGREVFATTDPTRLWTGAGLSAGVYFYYLTATDCAGRPVRWRGPVTLIR